MEMILHNSWKTLTDIEWTAKEKVPPNKSIVFVHTDHLFDFFRLISGRPEKYILISADSDYGVEYQTENTIRDDIFKWMRFIPTDMVKGFEPLVILPRCKTEACKITDQFCLKMYSFTKDTINFLLPDNIVHWFGTNVNVASPRLTRIPFGVSPTTAIHIQPASELIVSINGTVRIPKYNLAEKEDKIYCNFQVNTIERHELLSHLKYYDRCEIELNVSAEKYAESIRKYKYVLSPPGNGLCAYRTLEAIYSGAIPIIDEGFWSDAYDGLPVIVTQLNDLRSIVTVTEDMVPKTATLEKADFGYWRTLISNYRNHVLN